MFTIIHRFGILIISGTRMRAEFSYVHITICLLKFKEFLFRWMNFISGWESGIYQVIYLVNI